MVVKIKKSNFPLNPLNSVSRRIYRAFCHEVKRLKLIEEGEHILLAYSGGPDSTCLLGLLLHLRQEMPFHLTLAHLNHGLRKRAAEDENFVRQMARRFSLPLIVNHENVRAYARRRGLNLEEAGRELRYAFLERTRKRVQADKIATGHTMDDQAETFLLRLLRGSGPRGLAGISPLREGKIIRPLIKIRRRQVLDFLRQQDLSFRVDESNLDCRLLRNRVRLELIPFLEKKFASSIVQHLATAADILREEEDYLAGLEEEAAKKVIHQQGKAWLLDLEALSQLHPALARRLVRRFLVQLRGDLREINFPEVEAILCLQPNQEIHLRRKIKLVRLGHNLMEKKTLQSWRHYRLLWDGQGTVEIPGLGFRFAGRMTVAKELPPYDDTKRACLRADELRFPLLLRPRQPGDRYQPYGARGLEKVKDVMNRRHIPAFYRPFLPVFLSGEQVIWIPGCPIASSFQVQDEEDKVFIIERL